MIKKRGHDTHFLISEKNTELCTDFSLCVSCVSDFAENLLNCG